MGLLVAGKTRAATEEVLSAAPGCPLGEDVDLAALITSVKAEIESGGGDVVVTASTLETLEDIIALRAQQIPHLPIEDVKAIPSLVTLNGFVNDCNSLDSKQAFHDHALAYTKKEELVSQLISSMSAFLVSATGQG